MRQMTSLAALAVAAALATVPATALAGRDDLYPDAFVKMCDADRDGMVSKAEMMKMMEKMFDKHDTKKTGKLSRQQVEWFLQELMKSGA